MLIQRNFEPITGALARAPVVAVVGPRQVGKTTLVRELARQRAVPQARMFDLERASDRAAFVDVDALLAHLGPGLVVFDEVQFVPTLFQALRVVVDERR